MEQNIEEAKALAATWLREDEKFSTKPYNDPRGDSLRIGYGSRCPDGMIECEWIIAERMMAAHLEGCAEDVFDMLGSKMTPNFRIIRLAVLYCMCYQLGASDMRRFVKMRQAIQRGDFKGAAYEMAHNDDRDDKRSLWHRQTPERCERLAKMMSKGSG